MLGSRTFNITPGVVEAEPIVACFLQNYSTKGHHDDNSMERANPVNEQLKMPTVSLKLIIILCWGMISFNSFAQTEAPSWVEFAEKKESGKLGEATLSDYSYSGYHFSEKEIPDVSNWTTFEVTNYGAIPNDTLYDDAGIRAAIDSAIASNQPAVVYLPAGKYLVADTTNENNPFVVNASNIVLKGAGAGPGGTEIYTDQFGSFPWRFHFKAENAGNDDQITSINKRINRGAFTIEVQNGSGLSVGQVVELYHKGVENLGANMPGSSYKSVWNIDNRGVTTLEKHLIESINGNQVTFASPVQYTITADISGAELRKYYTIEEVGVEDILFTSGWTKSPEIYAHHASDFVDYAYRALAFENVQNGWIRNCEFRGWNESLMIEKSIGITVKNILISGKQGHTSYFARRCYGVLFEDCRDIVSPGFQNTGGQGHGPGMRWSTVNTVFRNCEMQSHQSIDCHGYHPYSNLLENVHGGSFRNNGGAENSYPNGGPYMTFWNFEHISRYTTWIFDFWDLTTRRNYTYANPIFVGFQAPAQNITLENTLLNELEGVEVYPKSLFDAQLQLRLYGAYMSASSSEEDFFPVHANDENPQTYWTSKHSGAGEWLLLDLGKPEIVNEVTVDETISRIKDWKLEAFVDGTWETIASGTNIGTDHIIPFDQKATRKLRFTVISMMAGEEGNPISINQFHVSGSSGYVSIDEPGRFHQDFISIYPNPNNSILNIEINLEGDKKIELYNQLGELVWQKTTSQRNIQLSKGKEWKHGLYIVRVTGRGNAVHLKKIVIY